MFAVADGFREMSAVKSDDFEVVIRLYRPKIFRFALASLRDRDAAETVTQDCFVKAYNARGSFRNDCSMSTWLMQIAVNLIRDQARSRRFQFWKRLSSTAQALDTVQNRSSTTVHSPEKHALMKEEVQTIWLAAEKLPEGQRTVFLLRFVEEMDLLEIAAATGLKEGTVKTHLFRALQSIRERVGVQKS